jgi:hypothetical protein
VLENASDRARESVERIEALDTFIDDEGLEDELNDLLEGLE